MTNAVVGSAALACCDITVGYGGAPVLHGLSLSVAQHSVTAVLGRNGAGKTTLLETLAGLRKMSSGRVTAFGIDVSRMGPSRRVRHGLVLVPQGRRMLAGMTVKENLIVGGHTISRKEVAQRLEVVCEMFPAIPRWLPKDATSLSGGQQQVVAIARAVMSNPRLLLLDEPLTGLSPAMVEEVCATIATTGHDHAGVLIAEQNAAAAISIADKVVVIDGHRAAELPPRDPAEQLLLVQERYFSAHGTAPGPAEPQA